jgi:hypothetical protein
MLLFATITSLAAADADAGAWMQGKWMVVSMASKPATTGGTTNSSMTMKPKPGAVVMEIGPQAITTTVRMPPAGKTMKREAGYVVDQAATDSLTIRVTPKGPGGQATVTVVKRQGANLVLEDDRSTTILQPYDAALVAKQELLEQQGAKPVAAVKDQPLTGRIAGQDWTPIVCRRSRIQLDESGKHIRVEAATEASKGFAPGTKPKLMIKLPTTVGVYPLGPNFNITVFTPPSDNQVLVDGVLHVTKVSEGAIEFSLSAHDDEGNEVNGRMTADVSPLGEP